jgi:hypothetical protein
VTLHAHALDWFALLAPPDLLDLFVLEAIIRFVQSGAEPCSRFCVVEYSCGLSVTVCCSPAAGHKQAAAADTVVHTVYGSLFLSRALLLRGRWPQFQLDPHITHLRRNVQCDACSERLGNECIKVMQVIEGSRKIVSARMYLLVREMVWTQSVNRPLLRCSIAPVLDPVTRPPLPVPPPSLLSDRRQLDCPNAILSESLASPLVHSPPRSVYITAVWHPRPASSPGSTPSRCQVAARASSRGEISLPQLKLLQA